MYGHDVWIFLFLFFTDKIVQSPDVVLCDLKSRSNVITPDVIYELKPPDKY